MLSTTSNFPFLYGNSNQVKLIGVAELPKVLLSYVCTLKYSISLPFRCIYVFPFKVNVYMGYAVYMKYLIYSTQGTKTTTSRFFPVDTGSKLNVHKTFRRRPGCPLNLFCTFILHPVSTGLLRFQKIFFYTKSVHISRVYFLYPYYKIQWAYWWTKIYSNLLFQQKYGSTCCSLHKK